MSRCRPRDRIANVQHFYLSSWTPEHKQHSKAILVSLYKHIPPSEGHRLRGSCVLASALFVGIVVGRGVRGRGHTNAPFLAGRWIQLEIDRIRKHPDRRRIGGRVMVGRQLHLVLPVRDQLQQGALGVKREVIQQIATLKDRQTEEHRSRRVNISNGG